MLNATNLTKRYGGILALDRVTIEIQRGEIVGYLGPNGSGKSTTVNIVVGLLEPSAGRVTIDGISASEDSVTYKRKIGYVPEEPYLYTHLTAAEYLELVGRLRGLPSHVLDPKIDRLQMLFQLHDARYKTMAAFSKGMRQRVLVAAALLHDPDLIVLDEPFSGLDVNAGLLFRALLQLLAAEGRMILFSTHRFDMVEKLCSRVVILSRGRLVESRRVDAFDPSGPGSLEGTFMRVTEQPDYAPVARNLRHDSRCMKGFRDTPWYRLTRHFYFALFDFGFLSDVGAMAFTRMVLGICGVILAQGLLLLRVFMVKYSMLGSSPTPDFYRMALPADYALLTGLSMWLVAITTALSAHAVFPDVTDFRILMPLPVTRALVFSAKVAAVILFSSIFAAAMSVALVPMSIMMAANRWADVNVWWGVLAFQTTNALGCAFAALSVIAIQGVLVALLPHGRPAAASARWRSALLCALIVSFPFVARLTVSARPLAREEAWLFAVPPVWFAGLERVLTGHASRFLTTLAQLAVGATIVSLAIVVASYAVLYRRFSAGTMQFQAVEARRRSRDLPMPWVKPVPLARLAVAVFTRLTMRRSVLHQGMFVALTAFGAGLVVNSFLLQRVWQSVGSAARPSGVVASVLWAPFALMFAAVFAARTAFNVPVEPRANWIFRTAEQTPPHRVDQVEAAARSLAWFGVAVPLILTWPVQALVIGPGAIVAAIVACGLGLILTEVVLREWCRIPFTCSYVPGKMFIPQFILLGILSFIAFTGAGTALTHIAMRGTARALAVVTLLIAVFAALAVARRRKVLDRPLAFEDDLPTDIHPFVLRD